MNVAIRDRDAMSSLTTWGVRAYLKSRGWMRQDGRRDRAAVYAKQHAGRIWEVLVPLRDTAVDYAESMARCLAVLATVEERSQLSVFGDLSAGSADVIRVRWMIFCCVSVNAPPAQKATCWNWPLKPLAAAPP